MSVMTILTYLASKKKKKKKRTYALTKKSLSTNKMV